MKVLDPLIADIERLSVADVEALDLGGIELPTVAGSASDLHFELALWARGLECFCSVGKYAFRTENADAAEKQNFRSEFQITHAVLVKCGELIEEMGRVTEGGLAADVIEFRNSIKALILCNNALVRNRWLSFAEWHAWCGMVSERLAGCRLYLDFDHEFEERGIAFLPTALNRFIGPEKFDRRDREDLRSCLSKLGGILEALEHVRKMLNRDAPLKPVIAIFAFVYETVNELVFEIGERLSLHDDETGEVFGMLDATAYTLAIESRKVYSHELASVIGTRSATLVFARVEAAFGILNDNIRHLLAGFAKLTGPQQDAADLFPEFAEKLKHSIELRESLWSILNAVRTAEAEASDAQMEDLRPRLQEFLHSKLSYLFYKDHETFERFCEEIMMSEGGSDVRPLLHRFSAYVETLFNQVGMRVVLANHSFAPGNDH